MTKTPLTMISLDPPNPPGKHIPAADHSEAANQSRPRMRSQGDMLVSTSQRARQVSDVDKTLLVPALTFDKLRLSNN